MTVVVHFISCICFLLDEEVRVRSCEIVVGRRSNLGVQDNDNQQGYVVPSSLDLPSPCDYISALLVESLNECHHSSDA